MRTVTATLTNGGLKQRKTHTPTAKAAASHMQTDTTIMAASLTTIIYFVNLSDHNAIYRIGTDGSGKELLLINVRNCMLVPVSGSEIKYEGHIYCGKSQQNETTGQNETHVMVYDLDGNSIGEVCRFDFKSVFLRQFVSSKEGVRWFAVGEEKDAVSWEDETFIR